MEQKHRKITVDEYTTPSAVAISEDTSFVKIRELMFKNSIRHILVTKGDEPIGIISERDILLAIKIDRLPDKLTSKDVMTLDPYIVSPNTSIDEVALNMSKNKFGSAIVQYGDGEFGIFTSTDALNALIEISRGQ